ncbi:MAG: methylated-DNA--[protein]-cysteine S-methyltransferase [Geminicoccaceae bacterium]
MVERTKSQLIIERVPSPIGDIVLAHDGRALHRLEFDDRLASRWPEAAAVPAGTTTPSPFARAVAAYFAGDLAVLDGLAVHVAGRDFETTVWRTLRQIECGTTWSYARLAASIGRPKAVRAVGAANGRNPISLVLPCHRVIGADGRLVGYGGGLERKAWLLRHEGVLVA